MCKTYVLTEEHVVDFGKCLCGRQIRTSIPEKSCRLALEIVFDLHCKSFERSHGETKLKMGWVVKKSGFLLIFCLSDRMQSYMVS